MLPLLERITSLLKVPGGQELFVMGYQLLVSRQPADSVGADLDSHYTIQTGQPYRLIFARAVLEMFFTFCL